MRSCFIIFAFHESLYCSDYQTDEDIQDIIDNISFFHPNCDFVVNHPDSYHPKVKVKHQVREPDQSSFIFGAFAECVKFLTDEYINEFDHFCLVSSNQYFINKIEFNKNVNYVQFLNTEDWDNNYTGKDFNREIVGFPLNQPYGRWDERNLYLDLKIEKPMSSNWECITLTKESMLLAKQNIDKCILMYPNIDMINIFPGYSALMSGQEWEFPKHFGTYDPSNPKPKNWIITIPQVMDKYNQGYFSVKRVNRSRNCPIKQFVRNNLMK